MEAKMPRQFSDCLDNHVYTIPQGFWKMSPHCLLISYVIVLCIYYLLR